MKRGITITMLTITIILMSIIIGTATAIGISSINTATYDEFQAKKTRVQNLVNEYYLENGVLPITNQIISKVGIPTTLSSEITLNNDTNNNLYVVNMNAIKAESVTIGIGSVSDMDVFLVAENTQNIYYFKGVTYKGVTYH